MSTSQKVLRTTLMVFMVIFFLMTPLSGLEPRPFMTTPWFAAIHPIGFVFLGGLFVASACNIAAFALLAKRPRRAATLALASPLLCAAGVWVDQTGVFASIPPPPVITALEYGLLPVELVVLVSALAVFRRFSPATDAAPPAARGPTAPPRSSPTA
jgi:hypothetical protein